MKKTIKKSICVTAMIVGGLCTQTAHAQWWSLTGNAGTTPGTNFLGTTDQKALYLKTKNLTRLAITASGNVGIGTTAPGYKLQVIGTGRFEDGVKIGGFGIVEMDAPGTVAGRLKIDSAGNVGIGITNPVYKLDIANDARINGVVVGRGNGNVNTNTAVGDGALNGNT
ncbi:MAG: hypothetical protein ABI855_07715, partial [Bacteroidota bacterium]